MHTPREKAKHQLKDRILKRLSTRQERTQQMKEEDKQNVHNALAEARKVRNYVVYHRVSCRFRFDAKTLSPVYTN